MTRPALAGHRFGDAAHSPSSTTESTITGLGPHGERPASPDLIDLSAEILAQAQAGAFRIAVVLHTTTSDWAQRQLAGIKAVLGQAGAIVVEVVDCAYDVQTQVAAIERIVQSGPDALISIPIGGGAVADVFRSVSAAGIRLILLDNAPSGLLADFDYVSVVSSDNFGLGQIAADLLSPYIPAGGTVCIVSYKVDFFATAEREIAFTEWMQRERPDILLSHVKFETPERAGDFVGPYLVGHPQLDGLFVVWDEPAISSLQAMEGLSRWPSMTTVDLGDGIAAALAKRTVLKGVAAQRPFEQGETAARVAVASLTGLPVPTWIVLPGLAVTAENVAETYRRVGGHPASFELMAFEARNR